MKTPKIIEKNKKAIISIDLLIPGENNQNQISIRGTGFIIFKDGQFITCAHVYNQVPENQKQFLGARILTKTDEKGIDNYDRFSIKFIKADSENDLALMKIISSDNRNFSTIHKIGDSEIVSEGDESVFIGYPLATELLAMNFGITLSTNRCIISSIKRRAADGSLHFFMIDSHVNNGSSGSPVFLKDSGEVIGIINSRISSKIPYAEGKIIDIPANMGTCLPINYVKNLIK